MARNIAIFDLDGTLLNSVADLAAACNYALEKLGYPQLDEDAVRAMVGDGARKLMERALPQEHSDDLDRALALFECHYFEHAAVKTKPYEGIKDVLDTLVSHGWRLAIVSNKPERAVKALAATFFPQAEVCMGDVEGRKIKPAPDMCLECMLALRVRRKDCVYIGDSDTDLMTAQNAGIPCISAAWGFRGRAFLESKGAKYIADTPYEVLDFLGGDYALE